jgi:spore germination protein GerM
MKRAVIIAVATLLVAAAVVVGVRFLGGDEDTWLCRNGQWVKHGNPSSPKPTAPCPGQAPEVVVTSPQPHDALHVMKVKACFSNSKFDPEISCKKVFPVEREIPRTDAPARAALDELLAGPTPVEQTEGYSTSLNPGVTIRSLTIREGLATVDFDEQLGYQVGGSCRVSAIRAQITETLMQFSTVKNVVISINGRTEGILQP